MKSLLKILLVGLGLSYAAEDFQRISALPILGYSEETKVQYGAMALIFFKPDEPNGMVPEIDISVQGTTRGQFSFLVTPYFYLLHDQIHGVFDLRYQNWVSSYFGIGNDPDFDQFTIYDHEKFNTNLELESSLGLPRALRYGISMDVTHSDIEFRSNVEENCSERKCLDLPEEKSGWRNGLGYTATFDTRDNKNWARHGFFAQWQQMFYSDVLGDYSYDTEKLDLRGYTYLFWKTSMAVGTLWTRAGGDVPFDDLSGPDGVKRFRGVESLYFSDNQALILQVELRKVLFWRLAGDIFFEGGKVGDHFSELMRNKWHRAIGFGGELGLNMKERLYARGEFSWVDNEHLGLTVYIRQAF